MSLRDIIGGYELQKPPLYTILAHIWVGTFGTSETATRFLSVLAGVAAIPLIYIMGELLFGRETGLLSAFLMSISQYQIYYSQEFRYYSLFMFLSLASFIFFALALRKKKVVWFVVYSISSIFLLYSHTFGVLLILVQNMYVFLTWRTQRPIIKKWILAQSIIILGILPPLIYSSYAVTTTQIPDWLPNPPLWIPFVTLVYYIGSGLGTPSPLVLFTGIIFLLVGTNVFLISIGKGVWLDSLRDLPRVFKDSLDIRRDSLLLTLLWLIVPLLFTLVLSKIVKPMYHHRYMIGASPAFYILVSFTLLCIKRVIPIPLMLASLLIVISPGLYEYYVKPVREQWREVAEYIENNEKRNDIIVFTEATHDRSNTKLFWYYRGNSRGCDLNQSNKTGDNIKNALNQCIDGNDRFWLVVREDPNPLPEAFRNYLVNSGYDGFKLSEEKNFTKITLYLFEREK